ncbi:unnamed protein product [Heterosigma akashiwo]
MVVGIDRYPKKVTKGMTKTKITKRSKMKPFLKCINLNHLMPTRYSVDMDLKKTVDEAAFKEAKKETRKTVKKIFEDRAAEDTPRCVPAVTRCPEWANPVLAHRPPPSSPGGPDSRTSFLPPAPLPPQVPEPGLWQEREEGERRAVLLPETQILKHPPTHPNGGGGRLRCPFSLASINRFPTKMIISSEGREPTGVDY